MSSEEYKAILDTVIDNAHKRLDMAAKIMRAAIEMGEMTMPSIEDMTTPREENIAEPAPEEHMDEAVMAETTEAVSEDEQTSDSSDMDSMMDAEAEMAPEAPAEATEATEAENPADMAAADLENTATGDDAINAEMSMDDAPATPEAPQAA